MVSLYPNSIPNPKPQEFYMDPMKMDLPGLNPLPTNTTGTTTDALSTPTNTTAFSSEDPNKKVRKPYTITKSRESWTEQEHEKFLEALQLFDRDWKKIEAFVGSKSVIQIRSHAQKYFLKVQKNGTSEHLPPPRPKRKASHPYPQKASKNAPAASQVPGPFPSSAALLEPGYVDEPNSLAAPRNPVSNSDLTSWANSTVPAVSALNVVKDDMGLTMRTATQNCSYSRSNESTPMIWPTGDANDQKKGKHGNPMRVMPDFAQVYRFIGSVFDPNASGHLQKLQKMDPIDVETVLLLMKNLSANLTSPEFEDHRRLLSAYAVDSERAKFSRRCNNLCSNNPEIAIPTV